MSLLKDYINEEYIKLKPLEKRKYKEDAEAEERSRNDCQRDFSRILYSPSFRRLQGKMQLLGIQSDKFYRNRLTHSLEVAQIARGIGERLRTEAQNASIYIYDTYILEACAVAHDLGNPPFGHHGEKILNSYCENENIGGFEGNAQTLRILMNLEKKLPTHKGLNLLFRTLLGVIKYYKKYEISNEKFIYDDNYEVINAFLENIKDKVLHRTLDVQVVDLADEIAYAAHDLEDALSLKLFTIDEFLYEFKRKKPAQVYTQLEEIVVKARNFASRAKNYNSSEEYGLLLRKEITSNLVHNFINDIDVVEVDDQKRQLTGTLHDYELGFKEYEGLVKGLKDYVFECINRQNMVQIYEKKGEKIIRSLLELFSDKKFNKSGLLMPIEYRCNTDEQLRKRLIVDYIAGMMDDFSIKTYETYYGSSQLNTLYTIDNN